MNQLELSDPILWHPLDHIENFLEESDLSFNRLSDHALVMHISGTWSHVDLHFQWNDSLRALFIICESDVRINAKKRDEVLKLIGMMNESVVMGHFEIRSYDDALIFRHGMCLRDMDDLSRGQIEDIVNIALKEFERYYPTFQLLIWGGHKAETAMELSMLETVGEA